MTVSVRTVALVSLVFFVLSFVATSYLGHAQRSLSGLSSLRSDARGVMARFARVFIGSYFISK